MSNYTNFNRHENMNSKTRSEILKITSDLIFYKDHFEIMNSMYGLFDGYLYLDVPKLVENLEVKKNEYKEFTNAEEMKSRILKVWNECASYPKTETIEF